MPPKPSQDERFARLPKWAQRDIETLERRVRELTAELSRGPEDSDTFMEPYTRPREPLGRGAVVAFVLPDGGEIMAQIRGEGLGTHVSVSSPNGLLRIIPQASNVVRVRAATERDY